MFNRFFNYIKSFFLILSNINRINEKKPKFLFYSESKSYLKYGYLIIKYLSKKHPGEVYYVSSDINDRVLDLDVKNIYVGNGFLLLYFFKSVFAENLFMTLTDLNNSIIKSNKFVRNYIYYFNGAVSTTKVYTSTAFDNYDTILCNGNYQVEEIRAREKLEKLKEKKLIKTGFFYFDYMNEKILKKKDANEILVAPSWNKDKKNFINEDFEEILVRLLNSGLNVRFRPHPETIKRAKNFILNYQEKFKNKNFFFDTEIENIKAMENAKCLITDSSGISIEYLLLFKKPVIFYDEFDKIHNDKFEKYKDLNTIENMIKNEFGFKFKKNEITNIEQIIDLSISRFNEKKIDSFIASNFYNFNKTVKYFDDNFSKICV